MPYYAVLSGEELIEVGTRPGWLSSHLTVELTADQAGSLLSGATSWLDWGLIDGSLRKLEQDNGLPSFADMLVETTADAELKAVSFFVTEKGNPLALYDTIKRPGSDPHVSFWYKKRGAR